MAMKRLLFIITVAITCLPICKAQTAADVTKNINKIKDALGINLEME